MAGIGTPKLPLKKLVLASVLSILKWCVLREKHCLFDLIFPDTNLCYILWQDIWIKALHFNMFSWNNNFVVIAVILRSRSNDRIRSICTLRSKKNKGMIDTRYYNVFFLKYKAFWKKSITLVYERRFMSPFGRMDSLR